MPFLDVEQSCPDWARKTWPAFARTATVDTTLLPEVPSGVLTPDAPSRREPEPEEEMKALRKEHLGGFWVILMDSIGSLLLVSSVGDCRK